MSGERRRHVPDLPAEEVVARLRAAGCVFAEDEARLLLSSASDDRSLAALVDRRVGGEPLEHLLGWAEFAGLRIRVGPGVFVPRPRTELLAEHAVELAVDAARRGVRPVVAVDLCCGSGALGAALLAGTERAGVAVRLLAADVDPVAAGYARSNLPAGTPVLVGDLDAPLPGELRGRVDVLLANVPYVPTGAVRLLPPEAREHEPRAALDGGTDGLDPLRRVAAAAPGWLAPGGHVLCEAGDEQAPTAVTAFREAGLAGRVVRRPETGSTVVIGSRPPSGPGLVQP